MKYVNEYRDHKIIKKIATLIEKKTTRQHTIMEICGGQTHSIIRHGIDQLLPAAINLIHGPGCPVCVTPISIIDRAIQIAQEKNVIFCSFGDMLRVPGSKGSLLIARAKGADVRVVYSPVDAVKLAKEQPTKEVVFFAVGFETTAPANAMAVQIAEQMHLTNFSLLTSQVLVPPAMEVILSSKDNKITGFLAAGHVCTVMGFADYMPVSKKYQVPIVVTGFEPVDILQGIYMCICQLEGKRAVVENQYTRVVRKHGNQLAQRLINKYFTIDTREWRGIGYIPNGGLGLRDEYKAFDAELRFGFKELNTKAVNSAANTGCIAGLILQGVKKPSECKAFGVSCFPENPLGAPMVSTEGACAAYYKYRHELVGECL